MAKKYRVKVRLVKRKAPRRRRNPINNSLLLVGGAGLIGVLAYGKLKGGQGTGNAPASPSSTPSSGNTNSGNQGTAPATNGISPVPDNIVDLMNAAWNGAGRAGGQSAWVAVMQGVYYMPASSWAWVYTQGINYHNETGGWAPTATVHQWVVTASQF